MKMYSVRSVLEWKGRKQIQKKHLYEERITIWNAETLDEAIALAEKEIKRYMTEESSKKEKMVSLGFYQAFAGFKEVSLRRPEIGGLGIPLFSCVVGYGCG